MTGILNYVWAAGLAAILVAFGWQEITLRHANSQISAKLDAEIQCLKGSSCASRLTQESAVGAALVTQARAQAASDLATQKAALDKQAADVVQSFQQAQATLQGSLVAAQKKYQQALLAPACAVWAKQVVPCDTQ
jgi:hypothetical protein